jgi:hypothetical protein
MTRSENSVCAFAWDGRVPDKTMREALARDGVVFIRDLLRPAEVESLRTILDGYFRDGGLRFGLGQVQPNAASYVKGLEQVFANPRVVAAFEAILGKDEVVFTGHCDIHRNMLSGWHKDSGKNGGYFRGDCFSADDCRVYKIGLYLQDQMDGNGLTVRPGSHRTPSATTGAPVPVASRAGDAIIFDVRLSHCGQKPDFVERLLKGANLLAKGGRRARPDNRWISNLEALYWRLTGRGDRLSIFFTFGAPNAHTREFSVANMDRQNVQTGAPAGGLPARVLDALAARGVRTAFELPP